MKKNIITTLVVSVVSIAITFFALSGNNAYASETNPYAVTQKEECCKDKKCEGKDCCKYKAECKDGEKSYCKCEGKDCCKYKAECKGGEKNCCKCESKDCCKYKTECKDR